MAATIALNPVGEGLAQGAAPPGTYTVTDFGDTEAPGQLRTLVAAAAPGDTIVIPAGTVKLRESSITITFRVVGGELHIDKDLTIIGAGPGNTVIEGSGKDRVISIGGGCLVPSGVDASVTISGVTVRNGSDLTDYGGGIANGGTLTLSNMSITANIRGGGLCNSGTAVLTDVSILGNTAAGSGGGIVNGGPLTLSRVTISGNSAGRTGLLNSGGGIFSVGPLTFTNVTISGNTAGADGGGIYKLSESATLTNVTISNNTAGGGGAGIFNASPSTMEFKNVIVANGRGNNCAGGGFVSLGHNISSDSACELTGPGDLSDTDPILGPLQNNGGPTATQALLATSPAIDAGDDAGCPDTDQRGARRPADGNGDGIAACDIGAYEVQPPCVGDCSTDGQVTIDELVLIVDIALAGADAARCQAGDVNADKKITVDEILRAVNAALNDCAAG